MLKKKQFPKGFHREITTARFARSSICFFTASFCCFSLSLQAATFITVDHQFDGGVLDVGSLSWAIDQANNTAGDNIIDFSVPTVSLGGSLPIIDPISTVISYTIEGGSGVTIDAQSNGQVFFVNHSTVANPIVLNNLTVQNGLSQGGTANLPVIPPGGNNAGGALGAGGALFVNSGADVEISNFIFDSNAAVGGNGGDGNAAGFIKGGGGGGGFNLASGGIVFERGGVTATNAGAGGGGFGVDGSGGSAFLLPGAGGAPKGGTGGGGFNDPGVDSMNSTDGTNGGGPSPGAGGTTLGTVNGGAGGVFSGGGGGAFDADNGGVGGAGGDFGGGGGGGGASNPSGVGGDGGPGGDFGGGGGGGAVDLGGGACGSGGAGGFGGGGGGGASNFNALLAVQGGNGGAGGFGGGGGGAGFSGGVQGLAGPGGSGGGDGTAASVIPNVSGAGGGGAGFGGAVFVRQGGTLTTNGLTLNNNTVTGGTGGTSGASSAGNGDADGQDFYLMTGSTTTVNVSDSLTEQFFVAGFDSTNNGGTLNKTGTGSFKLQLQNANSYNGDIIVNEGTFILDNFIPSFFTINSAGTLTGNGTASAILNSGNVSPGLGLLTVTNLYQQTSSGTYTVDVATSSSFSSISAGSATLNGKLKVVASPGFNVPLGEKLTILTTSSSSISGTFSDVQGVNLPDSFIPMVSYLPNSVQLFFGLRPTSASSSLSSYVGGFQQTIFSSVNHINIHLEIEMERLRKRFRSNKESSEPVALSSKWDQGVLLASNKNEIVLNPQVPEKQEQLRRVIVSPTQERRWNFYAGPLGTIGDVQSRHKQPGFDYWSAGALVGFDYAFSQVGVGLLADYEKIHADVDHHWGKFDIDEAHASLYATYAPSRLPELAFNGIVGGSYEWYDIRRNVNSSNTAEGSPHGNEYDLLFGVEYALAHRQIKKMPKKLEVIPLANLQYIHLQVDDYKEHGAGDSDLSFRQQKAKSLRSTLGTRINYSWESTNLVFTPEINLGWQREYLDKHRSLHFTPISVAGPISSIGIKGAGRNTALAGIDLLFTLYKRYGIEASYDFEWNELFQDHFFYTGFNVRF
ncbi:MAG: autotransporter outer membrane beta-barrel domain-containing protein [Chlamydiales bacterium]|nr:autotransporter outer membrane beta-barrel domain-containing protein [Chlamydiales bacterium]